MKTYKFTIYGKPMAKQRPIFYKMNGNIRSFSPKETVNYENYIKNEFAIQIKEFAEVLNVPLGLTVRAFFAPPQGTPKKLMAAIESELVPHTKKPDWDNLGKIISDALNGLAYQDDKQICEVKLSKRYSTNPRVEVELFTLN